MKIKKYFPIALVAAVAFGGIISVVEKNRDRTKALLPVAEKAAPRQDEVTLSESTSETAFFSLSVQNAILGPFSDSEQTFTMRLSGQEEAPMPVGSTGSIKRIRVKANAAGDFGPIALGGDLSEAVYSIVEEPPAAAIKGLNIDTSHYELHFKKDPQTGTFLRTITRNGIPADEVIFENTYQPTATALELKLDLSDRSASEAPFHLLLTAQENAPMPGGVRGNTISADLPAPGILPFGTLTFENPGSYLYSIQEDAPNGTQFQAAVDVLDFDGSLFASIRYLRNDNNRMTLTQKTVPTTIPTEAVIQPTETTETGTEEITLETQHPAAVIADMVSSEPVERTENTLPQTIAPQEIPTKAPTSASSVNKAAASFPTADIPASEYSQNVPLSTHTAPAEVQKIELLPTAVKPAASLSADIPSSERTPNNSLSTPSFKSEENQVAPLSPTVTVSTHIPNTAPTSAAKALYAAAPTPTPESGAKALNFSPLEHFFQEKRPFPSTGFPLLDQ